MKHLICSLALLCIAIMHAGCGIYSFTGASITGKTINIHQLENRARNIAPTLSPALTEKIRSRIVSQTGLSAQNIPDADYDITGTITQYEVSASAVQNTQTVTANRLTISVEINFENRKDEKGSFVQTFTRFSDFSAASVQSVEARLIDEIGSLLADDIFNKAFVNW